MIHGFALGLGLATAFVLVGSIMRRGLGRTIADLFRVAFWTVTALAAVLMFWWPPAALWLVIALLAWRFSINPRERGRDPLWANMLGFALCVGLLVFVTAAHLAGLNQTVPRVTSEQAPSDKSSWLADAPPQPQPLPATEAITIMKTEG
jgi:hypothetical protein